MPRRGARCPSARPGAGGANSAACGAAPPQAPPACAPAAPRSLAAATARHLRFADVATRQPGGLAQAPRSSSAAARQMTWHSSPGGTEPRSGAAHGAPAPSAPRQLPTPGVPGTLAATPAPPPASGTSQPAERAHSESRTQMRAGEETHGVECAGGDCGKERVPVVRHCTQAPVHCLRRAHHPSAVRGAQRLVAQADAQHGQPVGGGEQRPAHACAGGALRGCAARLAQRPHAPTSWAACGVPGPGDRTTAVRIAARQLTERHNDAPCCSHRYRTGLPTRPTAPPNSTRRW